MKYQYEFSKLVFHDNDEVLIIAMKDEKYRMIAQFLMSDVYGPDPQDTFDALDSVLSGESEYQELNGNVCGVEIYKEKTQIYDNLAEDGRGDWCEIETTELRKFVEIWSDELKRFREVKKSKVLHSS